MRYFKANLEKGSPASSQGEVIASGGFPSPAQDYEEERLDLGRRLVKNPEATFFAYMDGDAMQGAGIFEGDMLVIDKSLRPHSQDIVVAVVDGESLVRRLIQSPNACWLRPENPKYPEMAIQAHTEFRVWGVVSSVVRMLR